jgi:large repetitive protein
LTLFDHFILHRVHHRLQRLRRFITEELIPSMPPTLDTSALTQLATDLGTIETEVTTLQSAGSGAGDDSAAIAAAQESQLAVDQEALSAALAPITASVQALLTQLQTKSGTGTGTTSTLGSLSLSASTLSLAPNPLASVTGLEDGDEPFVEPPAMLPNSNDPPMPANALGQKSGALTISPLSITGSVGSPLGTQFTVDGGVAPFVFSGSPPGGLSLSSAGFLTGTASRPITDSFTMTVKDSDTIPLSQTVGVSLSIT